MSVFAPTLADVVRGEIGTDVWWDARDTVCETLGIPARKESIKNPEVVRAMLNALREAGQTSASLQSWAEAVICAAADALGSPLRDVDPGVHSPTSREHQA